jgi:tRNA (adenine-N(1)-)-methyltransferase non-catalytic subunit
LLLIYFSLFPDPVAPETGEAFVPENDNRSYTDTNSAQKLSVDELVELRDKGASGKEIIQKLVENSKTWDSKTEFSKQKYLKKKQQKYMPRVRFLKCTPANLCMTYRSKSPAKIW